MNVNSIYIQVIKKIEALEKLKDKFYKKGMKI